MRRDWSKVVWGLALLRVEVVLDAKHKNAQMRCCLDVNEWEERREGR